MAGSVATAISNSFLAESLEAGHCFLPSLTAQAGTIATNTAWTQTTPVAGVAVGMAVTGSSVGAGCVVAALSASNDAAYTFSVSSTGATSVTFTADVFKIALIASALAGNVAYGAGGVGSLTTNAGVPGTGTPTQANLGTDEQAASGSYAAGGLAIVPLAMAATNPINSAAVGFSTTIQWTGATLSVAGSMIYNTTPRLSSTTSSAPPVNNRVVEVFSFGGTQSVTNGTFTLNQPTQDGHTGLLRYSPN